MFVTLAGNYGIKSSVTHRFNGVPDQIHARSFNLITTNPGRSSPLQHFSSTSIDIQRADLKNLSKIVP